MINQTEQMFYRLSNLDTLQQRLTYQTSTKEKLQAGSDDSMLYSCGKFLVTSSWLSNCKHGVIKSFREWLGHI